MTVDVCIWILKVQSEWFVWMVAKRVQIKIDTPKFKAGSLYMLQSIVGSSVVEN